MNRYRKSVWALTLIVMSVVSANTAFACSRAFPTFKVRRDFSVAVKGRDGAPVQGVTVTIAFAEPTLEKVAVEVTNKEGQAFFHGLMVSDYWISGERGGVSTTVGKLWPVNDSSGEAEITLAWPMAPVVEVQSIRGIFRNLVGADVWLTDTIEGKKLAGKTTDQGGGYAFPGIHAGLYVLNIEEHRDCLPYMCRIKGRILVQINSSAENIELPKYALTMSSCGLAARLDDGSLVIFE